MAELLYCIALNWTDGHNKVAGECMYHYEWFIIHPHPSKCLSHFLCLFLLLSFTTASHPSKDKHTHTSKWGGLVEQWSLIVSVTVLVTLVRPSEFSVFCILHLAFCFSIFALLFVFLIIICSFCLLPSVPFIFLLTLFLFLFSLFFLQTVASKHQRPCNLTQTAVTHTLIR